MYYGKAILTNNRNVKHTTARGAPSHNLEHGIEEVNAKFANLITEGNDLNRRIDEIVKEIKNDGTIVGINVGINGGE